MWLTILMWIGIVLGAVVLLFVVLPIVYFMIVGSETEGIKVDISSPSTVSIGQRFEIVVSIENLLEKSRVLRSFDFDNTLLKGFSISKIAPAAKDNSSGLGTTAYYFEIPISARGSVVLTFQCEATAPGEFSGKTMAFIDQKHTKSKDTDLKVTVREAKS